jgi:radical S-adenosyl methionine domain-containing protein 2
MNMIFPYVIDFRPIGSCNLRCPFCFGPEHEEKAMSADDMLRVIDFVAKYGTKAVVLSGGEPTLIDNLSKVLLHMKSYKLIVVMSTNGVFFESRMDEIVQYLDWVVLPLDSSSPVDNQKMRVGFPQHFELILKLIPKIRSSYPNLKIRLNTVVCRLNKNSVVDLPEILYPDALPDLWKLYQVTYKSYGKKNQQLLQVTDDEFVHISSIAQEKASLFKIPFIACKNSGRDGKHLFINPNGDALAINNEEEVKIGNVFKEQQTILGLLPRFINEEELRANFSLNYPLK